MNGLPGSWRCSQILQAAPSFSSKAVPSLGQRPSFPAAPTYCFVWGLHQPACQLSLLTWPSCLGPDSQAWPAALHWLQGREGRGP